MDSEVYSFGNGFTNIKNILIEFAIAGVLIAIENEL